MDLTELLPSLDAIVFERLPDRRFVAQSGVPPWCAAVRPDVGWGSPLALEEVFPFLTVFLPEAEQVWAGSSQTSSTSDIWAEGGIHLRATAVNVGSGRALIISRSEQTFEEKQSLLQRARDLRIVHDTLMREMEQKDVLVHAIVHDLAAPLHSILGVLSLLGEQARPEPEASWVRIAIQAASRQRELIGEILDVLTAEDGSLRAGDAEGVELVGLIDRVIAERDPVARTRSLRIERGASLSPVRVVGEPMRLFRVLTNLVDNALRLSPQLGVVRVSSRRDDGTVTVFVEDEGPGVAPDVLPRLFEKFARARDSTGGTGLGLFFCRITVENWGGGIGYEPREPRGSRFWVRLPTITTAHDVPAMERRPYDGEAPHAR